MTFSKQTREETINTLATEKLDLLIIGGGITGAGLALQAGAKDMKAGLVEMQDFAAGTSSRSTKLVHGGMRYLKQFQVEVVRDITHERAVIHQNAPHIVRPDKMLLPIYDEPGASFTEFSGKVAMDLYDYLAEISGDDEWGNALISKEEVLDEIPALKEEGLLKGGLYLDYVNDDARLTTEIMKKANELGTHIANYVKQTDFLYDDEGQINGIVAEDLVTGKTFEIYADVVVNATGPWSDVIRNKQKTDEQNRMMPAKGVHFVVDADKLPVTRTVYTDTGLEDGRMIFVIPRGNKTYFGTTDTPYEGDLAEPNITEDDLHYLLEAINFRFPEANITIDDIETGWSGLRPLILEKDAKSTTDLSRGHDVFVSDLGLVTIAGGKLTDYRLMAEDTFVTIEEELEKKTGKTYPEGSTRNIPLSGGDLPENVTLNEYIDSHVSEGTDIGLTEAESRQFIQWYGTNVHTVFSYADQVKSTDLPLNLGLALLYALEHESVMTPEDFLTRRTDVALFSSEKLDEWKTLVVDYMSAYFGWDDNRKEQLVEKLENKLSLLQLGELR
jgi:glycerol-3-phosphate dehydrogenase